MIKYQVESVIFSVFLYNSDFLSLAIFTVIEVLQFKWMDNLKQYALPCGVKSA